MEFWVARYVRHRDTWMTYAENSGNGSLAMVQFIVEGWDLQAPFDNIDDAIEAICATRDLFKGRYKHLRFGVRDARGQIVWTEEDGTVVDGPFSPDEPQEEQMGDGQNIVSQPLNVDKAKLLERLQERKTEEEKARADAQAAITTRRQAAQDAIASLSPDELLNLATKYVTSDLDAIVEMVDDAKATGRLKSEDVQPNRVETAIDRWTRVLEMSTDSVIQVKPSDAIYPLL